MSGKIQARECARISRKFYHGNVRNSMKHGSQEIPGKQTDVTRLAGRLHYSIWSMIRLQNWMRHGRKQIIICWWLWKWG